MMGMALDFDLLSPLWPRGLLDQADMDRISHCRESIYHLADSTIDKPGEDKHSFLVTELIAGADAAGFVGTALTATGIFRIWLMRTYPASEFARSWTNRTVFGNASARHSVWNADASSASFSLSCNASTRFRAGDGAPLLSCIVFRR